MLPCLSANYNRRWFYELVFSREPKCWKKSITGGYSVVTWWVKLCFITGCLRLHLMGTFKTGTVGSWKSVTSIFWPCSDLVDPITQTTFGRGLGYTWTFSCQEHDNKLPYLGTDDLLCHSLICLTSFIMNQIYLITFRSLRTHVNVRSEHGLCL